MSSFLAICPAPFQRPKHHKKGKSKKHRGDGSIAAVQMFDRMVSPNMTAIAELQEPIVRKHSSPVAPPSRRAHAHHQLEVQSHYHGGENDSQQSTASNESHSTGTSGYQSGYATDDGTFECKMLVRATRDRPANLRMTAIRDYAPCCPEELAVRKGQRVKVLYKNNDWVYAVTKAGEAGYIPYSFVRPSRKYGGYQSEPEYYHDNDVYQSGYDTDMSVSHHRGHRNQIGDVVPTYSVHTAFRGSPTSRSPQCRRDGSNAYLERGGRPHVSGYTSAVEYPHSPESRYLRHHHGPRPAKSLHSILDASSPPHDVIRPTEQKPDFDSFTKQFIEELVVIHDFEAQEEDEVFVGKGERVKVLNAHDAFWLWVETTPGDEGFVPRSVCSLGNHPLLQSNIRRPASRQPDRSRHARRYYYDRSRQQLAARQARSQAKLRFHELAKLRKNPQNPVCMDKDEIKRVGSKLIVLMDYTATQDDELSIEFAETIFADVLKQTGSERIWAFCPRTDQCGYVPISLVVPPVV